MAHNANVAFGRYLRALREDRGYTLRRVCELSAEANSIDKAALSRFERGQQGATLSLLIPLSRIYDVPSDALIERYELDAELERLGPPRVEGKNYSQLHDAGRTALLEHSLKWEAYGLWREALERATIDPPNAGYTEEQQLAAARLNLATVARSLGKNRYALFEFQELLRDDDFPPALNAMVLDRIANCYRCLGEFDTAERFVDDAIAEALRRDDRHALAFAYYSRASNILDQSRGSVEGVDYLNRAFRKDREAPGGAPETKNRTFAPIALYKIADAYYHSARYDAAGRAAMSAGKLSREAGSPSCLAYSELILGLVDESKGRSESAVRRWRRAAELGRQIHNQCLSFSAEFFVFRQAVHQGNKALARASRLRLERMAPWVPAYLPELQEFKAMTSKSRIDSRKVLRQVIETGG